MGVSGKRSVEEGKRCLFPKSAAAADSCRRRRGVSCTAWTCLMACGRRGKSNRWSRLWVASLFLLLLRRRRGGQRWTSGSAANASRC